MFRQSGGTNTANGGCYIGENAGGSGTYTMSNGQLVARALDVGYSGTGSFTQSGGSNTIGGSPGFYLLTIGVNSGANGIYNLSGNGLLVAYYGEDIGYNGTGVFTQSGGTNTASGHLTLGQDSGSVGTYNLNGGLLSLSGSGLTQGAGNAAFYFSGGTFQAASSFSTSVPITLSTVGSNDVFDTDGNTLTLAGVISGSGCLQKIGAGLLILSGSNSYGEGTIVTAGTLEVSSSSALPDGTRLTVGGGATLIFDPSAAGSPITNSTAAAVPEPSSLILLGVGVLGLLSYGWRKHRSSPKANPEGYL